jgi:hypothetical protein
VAAGRARLKGGGNVPNWKIGKKGTEAQYIVVSGGDYYQRLQNWSEAAQTNRRKTGVNTGDFGRYTQGFLKNALDTK